MSLTVSPDLQRRAQEGLVSDEDFIQCIRESLPYAWSVVSGLAAEMQSTGDECADSSQAPPDDDAQGQLLRLLASDAMRNAIEQHYGMRLAFQNCCRVGLFTENAQDAYNAFVSPQAQLLNQRPDLVNC